MTGIRESTSGHPDPHSSDLEVEQVGKDGTHMHFNEQTNYVPKRTIIIVSPHRSNVYRGCEEYGHGTLRDIPL
jgi:hypothetical protein